MVLLLQTRIVVVVVVVGFMVVVDIVVDEVVAFIEVVVDEEVVDVTVVLVDEVVVVVLGVGFGGFGFLMVVVVGALPTLTAMQLLFPPSSHNAFM